MKSTKLCHPIVLLVLFTLCLSLSACGDSSDNHSQPAPVVDTPASSTPAPAPEALANEEPMTGDLDIDDTDEVPMNEADETSEATEPTQDDINGIVLLVADLTVNHPTFDIFAIDPATSERRDIASFCITMAARDDISYFYEQASFAARYGNYKDMFSPDYSKMAVTIYDSTKVAGKQERHAGWIDQDGNIFDLTQTLGIESDYLTTITYNSVGFLDENTFVFAERTDDGTLYYAIPLDDIRPEAVIQMDPNHVYIHDRLASSLSFMNTCPPTCWIDDTHYYGNLRISEIRRESVVVDITNGTTTELLSVDAIEFHSAMMNPARDQLAMIAFKNVNGGIADLVLMQQEGGSVSLVCNLMDKSTTTAAPTISAEIAAGRFCYTILDWK